MGQRPFRGTKSGHQRPKPRLIFAALMARLEAAAFQNGAAGFSFWRTLNRNLYVSVNWHEQNSCPSRSVIHQVSVGSHAIGGLLVHVRLRASQISACIPAVEGTDRGRPGCSTGSLPKKCRA